MLTGPAFYHWPRGSAETSKAVEKQVCHRSVRLTGPRGNIANLTAHLLLPSMLSNAKDPAYYRVETFGHRIRKFDGNKDVTLVYIHTHDPLRHLTIIYI